MYFHVMYMCIRIILTTFERSSIDTEDVSVWSVARCEVGGEDRCAAFLTIAAPGTLSSCASNMSIFERLASKGEANRKRECGVQDT